MNDVGTAEGFRVLECSDLADDGFQDWGHGGRGGAVPASMAIQQ